MSTEQKKQAIREFIQTCKPITLFKYVAELFERQMQDEKASNHTSHNNGIGFNGGDAYSLTLAAKWYHKHKKALATGQMQPEEWQVEKLRKMLPKYAGQLVQILEQKKGGE